MATGKETDSNLAGIYCMKPSMAGMVLSAWKANPRVTQGKRKGETIMDGRSVPLLVRMLLVLTALLSIVAGSVAQSNSTATAPAQRTTPQQQTIVDAAGRAHVRQTRITFAQRKAAAQRRVKAMRAAAAKRKLAEVKK